MSKKTIVLVFSAIAASVVAVVLGTTSMTYAAGDYGTHAKVADLNKCYTGGKLKPQIEIGSIYSVNDLLQGDGDILALPNNKGGNGLFSCGKLLQDIGVTIPKDDSKAQANLLTRLGYEGTGSNSYKCQVYTYRSSFTVEGRSSEVSEVRKSMLCASVDASDNIISFSSDGGSVQEVNGASFSPDGSQILINYADGSYGNVSGGIGNNFYTVASAVDSALRSHGYIYVDGLYGTGACFTEDWVHVSCSSDKAVHRSLPTSGIRFDYQGMSKGS